MNFLQIFFWLIFVAFELAADVESLCPAATVYIPMRDGLRLPTDLYYPPNSTISNDYACILVRVPAGRTAEPWLQLRELCRQGYVVAIQDTRSKLDVEGKTMPFISDGWGVHQDGFDTIEWLAKSPFTNGKIGTLGFSAAGITQFMLAPTAPSALKCQYIGQAAASLYHHAIFPGGQLHKHQVEAWLGFYAPHDSVLLDVISQPFYNDFWKKVDSIAMAEKVEVPALHYTGWFDTFLQGTIDSFSAKQEKGSTGAKGKQKLIIGPWNHFWPQDLSLGDFQLQVNGKYPPTDISAKRWFDYHLKGIDNGINDLPAVIYYVMGPFDHSVSSGNIWKYSLQWPVEAIFTNFYLGEDKLLSEQNAKGESHYTFESDPNNPVVTLGGRNLFLESGPKDQRAIEQRKDVLVFTTRPLIEDIEVTGKVVVKLYFSSDMPDTDVVIRLTDVYPDGKSILISDGLCRTGMPKTSQKIEEKESLRMITVDLSSTSIVFAKGHAVRLSIAGSNYPRYEKNEHRENGDAASKERIAKNSVYIGKMAASCLILPIVRKGDQWLVEQKSLPMVFD